MSGWGKKSGLVKAASGDFCDDVSMMVEGWRGQKYGRKVRLLGITREKNNRSCLCHAPLCYKGRDEVRHGWE